MDTTRSLIKIGFLTVLVTVLTAGAIVFMNHKAQVNLKTLWDDHQRDQQNSHEQLIERAIQEKLSHLQNQIELLSETFHVQQAFADFQFVFKNYSIEDKWSYKETSLQKRQIIAHYEETFAETLKNQSQKNVGFLEYLERLTTKQISFQHQYIANNPYKNANRSVLHRPNLFSNYADFHALHHPKIKETRDTLGIDDILFIDAQQGDIIYSVAKDFDFATNLNQTKAFDTVLTRAFQFASVLNQGDRSYFTRFETYLPAGQVNAGFLVHPIRAEQKTLGYLAFRMQPEQILPPLSSSQFKTSLALSDSRALQAVKSPFNGYSAGATSADLGLNLKVLPRQNTATVNMAVSNPTLQKRLIQIILGIFLIVGLVTFGLFFSKDQPKPVKISSEDRETVPEPSPKPTPEPQIRPQAQKAAPAAPPSDSEKDQKKLASGLKNIKIMLNHLKGVAVKEKNKSNQAASQKPQNIPGTKVIPEIESALFEAKVLATNMSLESLSLGREGEHLKYVSDHIHRLIETSHTLTNHLAKEITSAYTSPIPDETTSRAHIWQAIEKEIGHIEKQLAGLEPNKTEPKKPESETKEEINPQNRFKRPTKSA